MGLIFVESTWDQNAISPSGACGLTQVIPKYTRKPQSSFSYSCQELKNPKTSIKAGAEIVAWWVNEYGGKDVEIGLCGYSMGFRCKGKKIPEAGKSYSRKVIDHQDMIKKKFKELEYLHNSKSLEIGKLESVNLDFFFFVILSLFFYSLKARSVFT